MIFFLIIYEQRLDMQLLPEGRYKKQNVRPKHVKELHFCQSLISGVKGTTDGRLFIQLFKYLFIENSCTWCALKQSIVRSKFCRRPRQRRNKKIDASTTLFWIKQRTRLRNKKAAVKGQAFGGKPPQKTPFVTLCPHFRGLRKSCASV